MIPTDHPKPKPKPKPRFWPMAKKQYGLAASAISSHRLHIHMRVQAGWNTSPGRS